MREALVERNITADIFRIVQSNRLVKHLLTILEKFSTRLSQTLIKSLLQENVFRI